jgi:hypothetical protein
MGNSHKNLLLRNHWANCNQLLWNDPWMTKCRTAGHIFGREPSNDYFIKILFLLSKWFQTRRFLWEFPIGSYVKLAVLYPRWPPLLKIDISSNGQNCSILSQNVPKFELLKHNDELLNIYYGSSVNILI